MGNQMRQTVVAVLIVFQVLSTPAWTLEFNCGVLMHSYITEADPVETKVVLERADAALRARPGLTLEQTLALVGDLLGSELGKRFRSEVREQLTGVDVVASGSRPNQVEERNRWNRLGRWFLSLMRLRPNRAPYRARWENPRFSTDRTQLASDLFEAIRVAFSKDTVDRHVWDKATPQERVRLTLHFQARAEQVLFYQYRLYRALAATLAPGETLTLPSQADLHAYRTSKSPSKFLLWKSGEHLFQEVRLSRELVDRVHRKIGDGPAEDGALYTVFHEFIHDTFAVNFESYFEREESMWRTEGITILLFVSVGTVLAVWGMNDPPWRGSEKPPIVQPPSTTAPALTPPDPHSPEALQHRAEDMLRRAPKEVLEQQLRDLERKKADRGLDDDEKLLEEALKRAQSDK